MKADLGGREGAAEDLRHSARIALEGHLLGFAAEHARREGQLVDVPGFRAAALAEAS